MEFYNWQDKAVDSRSYAHRYPDKLGIGCPARIIVSSLPVVLTVAGSDSGGRAGIQADLKTFQALGTFGTSAITAITCQNSQGVSAIQPIEPEIVAGQIKAVLEDFPVAAIKTGMLLSAEIIAAVKETLEQYGPQIAVAADPVMAAASGDHLLERSAEEALAQFLPAATLITPNLPEAGLLLGHPPEDLIEDLAARSQAVKELASLFQTNVLLKGGHAVPSIIEQSANASGQERSSTVIDLFYDREAEEMLSFSYPRLQTRNRHGTGCTLSAAIAAGLAKGESLREAITKGRSYLQGAIEEAPNLGKGCGPLHHLWYQERSFTI